MTLAGSIRPGAAGIYDRAANNPFLNPLGLGKADFTENGKPVQVNGEWRMQRSDGSYAFLTPGDRQRFGISAAGEEQKKEDQKTQANETRATGLWEKKFNAEQENSRNQFSLLGAQIRQQGEADERRFQLGNATRSDQLQLGLQTLQQEGQKLTAMLADAKDSREKTHYLGLQALNNNQIIATRDLQMKENQQQFLQGFSEEQMEQQARLMESERRDRLIGIAAQMFGNIRF